MPEPVFLPVLSQNAAKSRVEIVMLDQDLSLAKTYNPDKETFQVQGELDPGLIQFYFSTRGGVKFSFHRGNYVKELNPNQSFLFYNPEKALPHEIILEPQAKLMALFVSVKKLHQWFLAESEEIHFLNNEQINRKFYADQPLNPALAMVIDQLFNLDFNSNTLKLYYRAKILEILSLYFTREEDKGMEKCPFLLDEVNVKRIRQAKQIIIERMANPPGLEELAKEIGLNTYQLKVGFKNIYGNTVHKYLTDYRMNQARKMLDAGQLRVNEVGYQVGFSNSSHFIAAFKKKFGVTPKKYLMFANR